MVHCWRQAIVDRGIDSLCNNKIVVMNIELLYASLFSRYYIHTILSLQQAYKIDIAILT